MCDRPSRPPFGRLPEHGTHGSAGGLIQLAALRQTARTRHTQVNSRTNPAGRRNSRTDPADRPSADCQNTAHRSTAGPTQPAARTAGPTQPTALWQTARTRLKQINRGTEHQQPVCIGYIYFKVCHRSRPPSRLVASSRLCGDQRPLWPTFFLFHDLTFLFSLTMTSNFTMVCVYTRTERSSSLPNPKTGTCNFRVQLKCKL